MEATATATAAAPREQVNWLKEECRGGNNREGDYFAGHVFVLIRILLFDFGGSDVSKITGRASS
jgi:hypothetical protein